MKLSNLEGSSFPLFCLTKKNICPSQSFATSTHPKTTTSTLQDLFIDKRNQSVKTLWKTILK